MAFGNKKQPEMFEAFRQSKGDQEPERAPGTHPPPPSGKPIDVKPPIPTAGKVKPPVEPSGQQAPKPIVPTLEEAKPRPPEPKLFDDSKPEEQKASETPKAPSVPVEAAKPEPEIKVTHREPPAPKPQAVAPGDAKPTAPAPKPQPVRQAVTPAPAQTPRPVGTAPSPRPSQLGGLKDSKDLHVMEFGRKSEVVFGMSYKALAWTIAGIVGAIIIIVAVAVAISRHTGSSADAGKKPAEASKTETGKADSGPKTNVPAATFPPGTYYSVQVTAPVANDAAHQKSLASVEQFLKDKRLGQVLVKANNRGLVSVFAGAFTQKQKADADALAKRIQLLMYNNRYDFKDATVVVISK